MSLNQVQLDVDSIDYGQLDRFVSGKLSGPAKWWVHDHFFHDVRSLDSHSSERANQEFVKGANWSVAKKEILKALNPEIQSLGIKATDIRFEMYRSKVRIILQVDNMNDGIEGALVDVIFALFGVFGIKSVLKNTVKKLMNGKFADLGLGISLSGVTI